MNRVRALAGLAGVVAAAVAIGVGELVAVATGTHSAPLVAVSGVVIDSVPEPVKELAIAIFYTNDKLALQVGTCLLLGGLATGLGLLALRRLRYGLAGVGLLGLVGAAAALTRAGATWAYPLPSVLGALAGAAVLVALLRRLPAVEDADLDTDVEPSAIDDAGSGRRRFLWLAGGGLGAAAVAGVAGRWRAGSRSVAGARAAVTLPVPASPAPLLPVDAGPTPFVTSNKDFYLIDTAPVPPAVDPRTWQLRIHGRVHKPLTITYAELLARPMIERYITLACVSNEVGGGLVGNARWLGVPIRDLLDQAEPHEGADQVVSRSVDGFTAGSPTAALRDGRDALLAVGMNGEPLPVEHGFPVRMVVPGLYGYVSATKWLAELELTRFTDFDAYWIRRGWAAKAPIKTQSRIDTPRVGRDAKAGRVIVAGVAWAQGRGIGKVEVRVGGAPWQEAALAAVPSVDTWRQWSWEWEATRGSHRLQVRATDNAGAVQTETSAPPLPDGATGWHAVTVTVR